MSMDDELTVFIPTGDVLVDGILRSLNQSGRNDTENVRALLGAVLWVLTPDLVGENAEMKRARKLVIDGVWVFERAVREAKARRSRLRGAGAECAAQAIA